ncbi:MAG: YihY/virulence factor BrkB family protein [Bacteroidia bacterium]|nr:YihY/virulence factor BrkB family protein [Bacteroidia bacterium]NNC86018.1 YihY/virulence factor BrkB family protein [Bacteroidia bacterium]
MTTIKKWFTFIVKSIKLLLFPLIIVSKKIIIPGFEGVPLYDVAIFFWRGIQKGSIQTRSRALAFTFFLALFPGILFLFTLIPYLPIEGFQDQMLLLIQTLLPPITYEVISETITDVIKRQRGGLLSIGFITALIFTTDGVNTMIKGFNKSYHVSEGKSTMQQWLSSLYLTFVLTLLIILAIALLVTNEVLLQYLNNQGILNNETPVVLLQIGKWIILLLLSFTAISSIYYFGTAKIKGYKFISAGSTLATILVILTSLAFNYFISNFGQYNKLYGSIGTLLIILLWIYFNALQLIIGFELNGSIESAKSNQKKGVLD